MHYSFILYICLHKKAILLPVHITYLINQLIIYQGYKLVNMLFRSYRLSLKLWVFVKVWRSYWNITDKLIMHYFQQHYWCIRFPSRGRKACCIPLLIIELNNSHQIVYSLIILIQVQAILCNGNHLTGALVKWDSQCLSKLELT